MVLCTGCNREFSASGFTTHVNRTTTAVCWASRNLFVPYDHIDIDDNDIDMEDTDPRQFAGDFYGHYEQADFGWLEGDEAVGTNLHYLGKSKYLH